MRDQQCWLCDTYLVVPSSDQVTTVFWQRLSIADISGQLVGTTAVVRLLMSIVLYSLLRESVLDALCM